MNTSFKVLLLLCLCFLVSGCQTTITSDIRTDYDFQGNQDTGLIVGTVSHPEDTDSITFSSFYINFYSGNPKAALIFRERGIFYAGHPAEFEFEDSGNKGKLFVLELPAGEHSVDHWAIQNGYTVWYPKSAPSPLEFMIQPGEVLYLGNFHMQIIPPEKWYQVNDGGFPTITDKNDRDIQLFRKLYPSFSARNLKLNVLHQGHWTNELTEPGVIDIPVSN